MKKLMISAVLATATVLSAGAASAGQAWIEKGITLNARSGPGTQYHVLGKFNPCTPVHVVAQKWGWAKVAYNHKHYWVSAKYLQGNSCHYGYNAHKPKPKHYSGY